MRSPLRPPLFHPGDEVEVYTRSKGFIGGCYEARVDSCCPSGQYLVVYNFLTDGNSQPLRETVSAFELRPRRPPAEQQTFALGEPIEAFFKHGWWHGQVSKVQEGEYTVFLTKRRQDVECTSETMRRRSKWVGGDWVEKGAQRPATTKVISTRSPSACDDKAISELNKVTKNKRAPSTRAKMQSFQLPENAKEDETEDAHPSADSLGEFPESCSQGDKKRVLGKRRQSHIPQKSKTPKRRIVDMKESAPGDSVGDHQDSLPVNKSSVERRSTLLSIPQDSLPVNKSSVECRSTLLSTPQDSLPVNKSSVERRSTLLSTPQSDIASDLIPPLPNESQSKATALPFEKRSPMWKYIDQEVMPKVRQHPHFRPLEQFPEVQREGIAVGLVVTYEHLISRKCGLKDSSTHNLDAYLKSISDLEGHGFEIQHLKAHLEELRRLKTNHMQLLQKKSVTEGQAFEINEKCDRLKAELEATDKTAMALKQVLGFLHGRRSALSKQKEESETINAKAQRDLRLAEEELVSSERALRDFLSS